MKLKDAMLCVNDDTIFEGSFCPECGSKETYLLLEKVLNREEQSDQGTQDTGGNGDPVRPD